MCEIMNSPKGVKSGRKTWITVLHCFIKHKEINTECCYQGYEVGKQKFHHASPPAKSGYLAALGIILPSCQSPAKSGYLAALGIILPSCQSPAKSGYLAALGIILPSCQSPAISGYLAALGIILPSCQSPAISGYLDALGIIQSAHHVITTINRHSLSFIISQNMLSYYNRPVLSKTLSNPAHLFMLHLSHILFFIMHNLLHS